MSNQNIRETIEKAGLKHYEVAEAIGISPFTLSVWMRHELTGERLRKVKGAIEQLKVRCAE